MREYKHAYCSGQSYSTSISASVLVPRGAEFYVLCMYTISVFNMARVLHFSAFIITCHSITPDVNMVI